jgi:death-on-curing protein
MAVFLELNGWTLDAPEPEVVRTMLAIAEGRLDEPDLASWLRVNMHPVE